MAKRKRPFDIQDLLALHIDYSARAEYCVGKCVEYKEAGKRRDSKREQEQALVWLRKCKMIELHCKRRNPHDD